MAIQIQIFSVYNYFLWKKFILGYLHSCNPVTWKVDVGTSGNDIHAQLYNEFEVSVGNMLACREKESFFFIWFDKHEQLDSLVSETIS